MANMILSHLIVQEQEIRKVSFRKIARETGLANTTIMKMVKSREVELSTAITMCEWLGVPLSVLAPQLETRLFVEYDYLQKAFPGLAEKMLALANCYTSGLLSRSDIHVLLTIIDMFITRTIRTGNAGEET